MEIGRSRDDRLVGSTGRGLELVALLENKTRKNSFENSPMDGSIGNRGGIKTS